MKHIRIGFWFLIFGFCSGQQTDVIDVKTGVVKVNIVPDSSLVSGMVAYTFDVLKTADSMFIDAENLIIHDVFLNNEPVGFSQMADKIVISHKLEPSRGNSILILYDTRPKKAMYFVKRKGNWQVWTQGQGKYTSNWLPSFDDMNEKVTFSFSISTDKDYVVIANGELLTNSLNGDKREWLYEMKNPMSNYLVALAIGDYKKKAETSKSGIPIEYYYYPEDSLKVESTYRYSKRMFDFLEEEIGFAYPWQNYKQVPVHDFLYAGMENTSCTIFSDAFVTDSIGFNDRNYVNVNAHELAHQWFGNLVTATSGTHHWLQEGFATYYALRAERDIFGADYYDWELYQTAQQLWEQDKQGQGTSLLDPKSSSLTFYQRGAWVLHALRLKIGGKALREAVQSYLEKHQFGNVETDDFLREVVWQSEQDRIDFTQRWIINDTFPYEDAMQLLESHSTFIQEYLMADCEVLNSKCDDFLNSGISDQAKAKIISQVPDRITSKTFKSPLKVRQAIAGALERIPLNLKAEYETLLNDPSYVTREIALTNLWRNFPEDRAKYLEMSKYWQGFSDKNLRILWLTLATITEDYRSEDTDSFIEELTAYTSSNYGFNIRQNAFQYLKWIRSCGVECQRNLEEASKHHNWRFRQMAKQLLND